VVPVGDFLEGIDRELRLRDPGGAASPLETLYLGGGTPSRLGGDGVRRLLDRLRAARPLLPDAEVTIEVNPEDVTRDDARRWAEAGVTRASLGVQSFSPRVLEWMHRGHRAESVVRAVEGLRDAGLASLSVDLIFALPASLERDWSADLDAALALAPDHLSLYGLTVEPRTPLGRWVTRGEATPADDERYAAEFLEAHRRLTAAGYEHYEVSNYARRVGAASARARHNSAYWRGVPFLALGPGAHGFDGTARWWNRPEYAGWLADLRAGRTPEAGREGLDGAARAVERVYLGLRTLDGLTVAPDERPVVEEWVAAGWAAWGAADRVWLTAEGWLRLDALASALTAIPSRCEL
jgi:oxygen-independent coproporphyrinogen-3 oxidase